MIVRLTLSESIGSIPEKRPEQEIPILRGQHMSRLIAAFLIALIIIPGSAASADDASVLQKVSRRPNILLIYVDNLGYGDAGCYGNAEIKTPRIDQLAREGVRCTDFYVVSPTCTVSRGALLTGRQPFRNGLNHQLVTTENWTGIGLPHREKILPEYLKEAGYGTACFGKWNIGFAEGSRPTERGFDEFFGCRSGNIHYFRHTYHGEYDIFRGTEREHVDGYSTDIFADAACDYIRRKAESPFFVYLPFNAPHYVSTVNTAADEKPEWHVPDKYLQLYGWLAGDQNEKHRYLALLTALDDAVGRVLDTLDEVGQRQNTLVMFISDMGAILRPTHGLGVASNAPFRDGAPSLYEGGIRVPAIFRWPGVLKPGSVSSAMLSHLDVLPLCLAVSGAKPAEDRLLDGRDPLAALSGAADSPHERLIFTYRDGSAVREGPLKIVRSGSEKPWELYDLVQDPAESANLAGQRPDDVARLDAVYQQWLKDVRADASQPAPRPTTKKN